LEIAVKAVILAGGLGTRLSEETAVRPKPMVEVGGRPILWHIMKIYAAHGVSDFVLCLGYKGYVIKEYFANYFLHMSDVTIDLSANRVDVHQTNAEPWRVSLIDTGEQTMTGGRLRRVREFVGDDDFCLTYGDGVGDVDIGKLIERHQKSKKLATVTVTRPPGRFGAVKLNGDVVDAFLEKPEGDGGWINAGFFVLSPAAIDYATGDDTVWEGEPMERLASDGQLGAWKHEGFWQPMDVLRDKQQLETLWQSGDAPWKIW
jgi:glucose-1-phosphate cytidylyltransferase